MSCFAPIDLSRSPRTNKDAHRDPFAAEPYGSLEEAMWRFAQGDADAFASVYRMAAPRIYSMLVRLCREPALAEDLMQDTFVRMHRARGAYRRGAEVLPWAFTIGRRLFIDTKRHRRREVRSPECWDADHTTREPVGPAAAADEELSARRMAQAVEDALSSLPPRQAEAFRLVKAEGMSLSEAATLLGETNMALRLRTHRATQAIREVLEASFGVPADAVGRKRARLEPAAQVA